MPRQPKKALGPPKLVCIHWLDHYSDGTPGWKSPKDFEKADISQASCLSVGWVIKETKSTITIVSSWNSEEVDGDVTIIKKAIADIWELPDPSIGVRSA